MIWSLFKPCGKNKKKSNKPDDTPNNNPNRLARELLPRLDVLDVNDDSADGQLVFVTDTHFACLSVIDTAGHRVGETTGTVHETTASTANDVNRDDDIDILGINSLTVNNRRGVRVTENHLKSLQCPFTWCVLDTDPWMKHCVISHVQKKYGKYNTDIRISSTFSLEKYISNLIIGCGQINQNVAHDKLIDVWEWLDKLDDKYEPFYVNIRDGLKHVVMSALCHILFVQDKMRCQQLFEMTTRFNAMSSKNRAAVYGVRAAVCVEYGGEALKDAVEYASKACDLDPDTAQWSYYRSVTLTAHRQHLNTHKSCPTDDEFDAVQRAIILTKHPNAYFNHHRVVLMANKILHSYRFVNNGNATINSVSPERARRDFDNVIDLIKTIMTMEPEDPHLIVKCAKSLMTLPYLSQDNIHLIKQIISIAINKGFNDSTVIEAIEDTIEIYRILVDIYEELREKETCPKNAIGCNVTEDDERSHADLPDEDGVDDDLRSMADKHRNGGKPLPDLHGLLDKHNGGHGKWKITAQICSYSILFKDPANYLGTVVKRFTELVDDRAVANSDIITNHRSLFTGDRTKAFNLADLVCNEIKMAVGFGRVKNADEVQFYLDQLTKITEACRLKSKKINTNFASELLEPDDGEPNVSRLVDAFNQRSELHAPPDTDKQTVTKKHRHRSSKRMPLMNDNHFTRLNKIKPRRKNYRH